MKILVTGSCGFVGSSLIAAWLERGDGHEFIGFDNLSRPGSEYNRPRLRQMGVQLVHGDLRAASDLDMLGPADWVIDAAANPSVLGGVDGRSSARQLLEHNLWGTVHLLEYCRRHQAGLILLSTSRVYSIRPLTGLPLRVDGGAFRPDPSADLPAGLSEAGVSESFPTTPPVSLYGASKVASEMLALEYGETYDFPVWINRCGVLAGAGQFGHPEQGIFSYWLHSWAQRRPLRYIGFGQQGHQVRDMLHPDDLLPLIEQQFNGNADAERICNVSGGAAGSRSLRQLSEWCTDRFGAHDVTEDDSSRPFDVPWLVLDPTRAHDTWGWRPSRTAEEVLEEIAGFAESHPEWLERSRL